jgi:glycosyltransferase involved in cell wall biosynthesis
MPTIGYNALALRPRGSGVQTYIRELLSALAAHQDDVGLVATVQADVVTTLPAGVEARPRSPSDGLRRALTGLRTVGPCDLVHGLDVDLPLFPKAPAVSTVHDLSVFDVPWAFSRVRALGEQAIVRQALRRADVIVAVSSFTAERIAARFNRESIVVPEAAPSHMRPPHAGEVSRVRARYALPDRFVLQVGTVEPRKDVGTLAAACREAGVALVLAGSVPAGTTVEAGARALGYVPDGDLAGLYGAAAIVAYSTRYEGFGLPPLEAMACGAPVVASDVASLPEVLGRSARLVAPGDTAAWAATLRGLLADEPARAELAAAGQRHAATMSWPETAHQTLAVYQRLGLSAQGLRG